MNRFIVLFVIFFVCSCTDNENVPDDVLPKAKMEKLLWDMVKADRFTSVFLLPKTDSAKKDSAMFSFYDQVFQINKVTREQFLKSYKFYMGRPDLTKVMFDSIAAKAERSKTDMYKNRHKDRLKDSTQRKLLRKPLKHE